MKADFHYNYEEVEIALISYHKSKFKAGPFQYETKLIDVGYDGATIVIIEKEKKGASSCIELFIHAVKRLGSYLRAQKSSTSTEPLSTPTQPTIP
jgi:hypothetical protein